jgi:hypothetical protein
MEAGPFLFLGLQHHRLVLVENLCMSTEHDASPRLKTANTVLALVVLVLLGTAAWQAMRVSAITAELRQSERALESRVESLAIEKLQFHREEMAAAVQWLDDVYRGKEGLQRPGGLVRVDSGKPDGEAIGAWILDVYLKARIGGASEEEARTLVMNQIKTTDEWRAKHPKG